MEEGVKKIKRKRGKKETEYYKERYSRVYTNTSIDRFFFLSNIINDSTLSVIIIIIIIIIS